MQILSKNCHKPLVGTYITKCLKKSVRNRGKNRFRLRKVEEEIWAVRVGKVLSRSS